MMKPFLFYIVFVFIGFQAMAQNSIDSTGFEIQKLAFSIQDNEDPHLRKYKDSLLTLQLLETLQAKKSFNFQFDSLQSIRQIIAPDGKFKIFTWQLALEKERYVQKGILQYKTSDTTAQLISLLDNEYNGSANNWTGAIYYDIILNEFKDKKYYTLLGFKPFTNDISQKIMEVLYFENDQPIFGGDFFTYANDETFPFAPVSRFILSYKKGSNAVIRFDKTVNTIYLSELTSIHNKLNDKSTLVPTGEEINFIWKEGKWVMKP